jgi:hypothetical protein
MARGISRGPGGCRGLRPSWPNADRNETDGRVAIGCSLTIWTVVEARRRPGLDGRKLPGGIDIRTTGLQHRAPVIPGAGRDLRAPGVRS